MHLAGIDANLLTTLDALLREQSVSRAARRIGLSPSATSHALSRLRSVLDDPLLVRAGRAMVLTPRAERLAPRVRQVVREMARVFSPEPGFRAAELEREFHYAVAPAYMPLVDHSLGRTLAEDAPRLVLRGRALPDDPSADLRGGELDLAIGVFDGLPDDIELERLFVDDIVCLVRRGHRWITDPPDIDAFVQATHVIVEPRALADRAIDSTLARCDRRRRHLRTVGDRLGLPFAVAGSDAVAVVGQRFAEVFARPFDLTTLALPLEVPGHRVCLAWHRRNEADPGHRWFRERVVELIADPPALSAVTAA